MALPTNTSGGTRLAHTARKGVFAASALALMSCGMPMPDRSAGARPSPPAAAPQAAEVSASTESQALTDYYARLQRHLLAQGLLRTDGGGPDTPFTDTDLARNFVRIALFNEYSERGTFAAQQETISSLRRWDNPIRMQLVFDDSLPAAIRAQDRAEVESFTTRLSELTKTQITLTDDEPNFHLLFLSEDSRLAFGPQLKQMIPNLPDSTIAALVDLPDDQLCVVVATFEPGRSTYDKALAIIRTEHPRLMRQACIHEELAQGMGLANDSPQARPSIFNDDEEFAFLTNHDMLLLQMLYDPRLQPGMTAAQAAPIARQIARDYMTAGNS